MKFLVLSRYGEIVDVCRRIKEEGNEVLLFIKDIELQHIGEGLVDKLLEVGSDDFKSADVIIFDDSCWGDLPQKLRKKGYKVIGGSALLDSLEDDREKFFRVCNLLGIKTPKTLTFNTINEAIKYIKKYPNQYVLKSYSAEKSITFVSKTPNSEDLVKFLQVNTENIKKVVIQQKVRGYEVAISCFFNGDEFIPPCIVNYEHKKFGNDNTGVFTGEMGTVLYYIPTLEIKFFKETLKKLSSLLKGNYVGIIDVNCIANTSGVYVLELTPRFGYPITDIMSSNIKSWSDLFLGLVNKDYNCVLRNLKIPQGVGVGVVIAALSPFDDKNCLMGLPLIGITENTKNNFSFYGVVYKNNNFYVADKYVGVCHYTDKNIDLARQNVYALCEKICVPDLFYYRTDIGENTKATHKWLTGIKLFS